MIDVVMPQMGESIVEGTLTKWLKKPGEHVERDEPLFEISTDKVDTEIPVAGCRGPLRDAGRRGKTVAINTVVARIDEGGTARRLPRPRRRRRNLPCRPRPRYSRTAPASAGAAQPAPQPPRSRTAARAAAARLPTAEPMTAEAAGPLSPLVRRWRARTTSTWAR